MMSDASSIDSECVLSDNELSASVVSDSLPAVSTPINSPALKRIRLDTSLPSPVLNSPLNSSDSTSLHSSTSTEDPDALFLSLIDEQSTNESTDPDAIFLSDSETSIADATTPRDHLLLKIAPLLISNCCKDECLRNLSATDVVTARTHFSNMDRTQQRKWLTERIRDNTCIRKDVASTKFIVGGQNTCKKAWCRVYDVSEKRVTSIVFSITKGLLCSIEHGNKGKKRPAERSEDAVAWMRRYFHLIGDQMPHNNQVHLPSWDTQKNVYERYKDDMTMQSSESSVVSLRSFYRLWADEFPNVVIPEEDRFAKCDICVKIKMERRSSLEKNVQKVLKDQLDEHLKRVIKERKKYHRHREKSRADPDKYGTVIIDGMDQAKTNLPHTRRVSKSTSGLWRLRTHVTGSLFHTQSPNGKLAFSFIDLLQWPHGSNLTCTILMKVLLEMTKTAPLPETLYIQLDNTSRENKNKYVLAFCSYLVEKKIFKKVRVNFLPVGHTHEDVDQLFSKIASEISRTGCESLPELLEVIHRSSKPNPKAQLLDGVWDFKSWLEPYLSTVKFHSKYICFKFIRNSKGKAEMFYRRFTGMAWEPNDSKDPSKKIAGLTLLSEIPSVEEVPSLLHPTSSKLDPEHLLRDLPKYKPWITAQSSEKWETFISQIGQLDTLQEIPWEISKLIASAEEGSSKRVETNYSIDPTVTTLLEKETAAPPKIVANPKKRRDERRDNNDGNEEVSQGDTQEAMDDETDTISAELNTLVATYIPEYKDEIPQIGRVVSIDGAPDTVTIEWLQGTYSSLWKVCKKREGRALVPWREEIPQNAVISSVQLTKGQRLPGSVKDKLKSLYAPLLESQNQ